MKTIHTWYDRSLRLWTSIYKDVYTDQVGVAGYGTSKQESLTDLQYQNSLFGEVYDYPCKDQE